MKQNCTITLLLILLRIFPGNTILAQNELNYSIDNGLSKNTITAVLKDKHGYMWFGTWVGLNKFDGYKFTTFLTNNKDSNSISENNIRKLLEDKYGNIWIATTNGLNMYDYEKGVFKKFFHHNKNNRNISDDYINTIFIDNTDNLWIGTVLGLERFDYTTKQFEQHPFTYQTISKKHKLVVWDIIQDRKGKLWIANKGQGLVCYNRESETFVYYNGTADIKPTGDEIDTKKLELTDDGMIKIFCSEGNYLFDPVSKLFKPSRQGNFLPAISPDFSTSFFYKDPDNISWYGTFDNGIYMVDPTRIKFKSFKYSKNEHQGLSSQSVISMAEGLNRDIWIGTNRGLNLFSPVSKTFQNAQNSRNPVFHIPAGNIMSLCFDSQNTLWIGTENGIFVYDNNHNIKHYVSILNDSTTLLSNFISSIFEDSKGNVWVGAAGLNCFNRKTQTFKRYKPEINSERTVNSQWINTFYEDAASNIWMATWAGGINILDPKTGKFSFMLYDAKSDNSLCSNDIANIYGDSYGVIWITTSKGLNCYNTLTHKITLFTSENGLPTNGTADVLEDNSGNMWISSGMGLSKYLRNENKFKNYDVSDGLQSNEFNTSASVKDRNGCMYFGGINGLSLFYPDSIKDNLHIPPVKITDFQIFNKPVKIGEKINNRVILEKEINITKKIILTYRESVFSFEFAALDFTNPNKNKYAYTLENFEHNWNYTDAKRRYATYTNINPGKYIFKVKASNNDDVWNQEGIQIEITILPPWWKSFWFKLLLVILIILSTYSFNRYKLNAIKVRNRKLELLVQKRTNDLVVLNNQLEQKSENLLQLNSELEEQQEELLTQKEKISNQLVELEDKNVEILNMSHHIHESDTQKLQYFTNIAHEFRTPLTLIISPLKNILETEKLEAKLLNRINIINNNAERLLRLINQLLDIRKFDSGNYSIQNRKIDLIALCNNTYKSFLIQAENRSIQYTFNANIENLNVYMDTDKVEKILINLLSNAFKFTGDNGEIGLHINFINNTAEIKVTDTGKGIPQDLLMKIFEPFYQVDSSSTRFHEGTGIGLYHTKELIEILNGSITVSSVEQKGTEFTVTLPVELTPDNGFNPEITEIPYKLNESEKEEEEDVSKKKNSQKPLLLIVEDNSDLRAYIKEEFEALFQIIEASNGKEGFLSSIENYPDLIISDIMMPEMDGLQFCKILKTDERTSHIPVILLTAKADEQNVIEGFDTGADDYITKPFSIKLLIAKVDSLLKGRRKLREKFSKEVFAEPEDGYFNATDKRFLEKLTAIIEKNISNSEFQVADLAFEIGMGKTNLYKKIIALTNLPAGDFIRTFRLKHAARLLLSNEYSVTEVAGMIGFKDTSHFIKSFTRQYDFTPKKFIAQNKKQDSD